MYSYIMCSSCTATAVQILVNLNYIRVTSEPFVQPIESTRRNLIN
jgi:hypothetical protein